MTMAEQLSHLAGREVSNPDAQATITDFIDYTEFFSSDLLRSLTLISTLDQTYKRDAQHVHELTKTYGRLPTLPVDSRPEPQQLRRQISLALDHATACRESTFAEASRLYDTITRLYDRLSGIKKKLMAMPAPPSRDPSPVASLRSPVMSRTRKPETERIPRLKLLVDGGASGAARRHSAGAVAPKSRVRRLIVPGEVLPPRDLNSPEPSSSSEQESSAYESDSSIATPAPIHHKKEKSGTQASRLTNPVKLKLPKATQPRIPGMGTNAHSSVAGISTSNAIALLERPPDDAKPGSVFRPWLKLTEYEMAMLRKKMKKNAIWHPSATMVRRELQARGRGMENYRRARAHAEAAGVKFLDEDPITTGSTILAPGEMTLSVDELSITNRGMKLNEAKKLKRENLMREQAAKDAAEIEEAERRISAAGLLVQNLFSHRFDVSDTIRVNAHQMSSPGVARSHKRKRRASAEAGLDGQTPQTGPKRLRIGPPATVTTSTTTKVPLAPPGPSESPLQKLTLRTPRDKAIIAAGTRTAPAKIHSTAVSADTHASGRSKSPSRERTPKLTLTLRTAPTSEDSSRRTSLRNASSTAVSSDDSAPQPSKAAGGQSRPKKRMDPVLAELESTNPAPTRIRLSGAGKKATAATVGDADPDEPRYCICGEVSWGDMVACDNDNCKMEWFHWSCVGLTQQPGRREKWYCPPCRKLLGVDVHGETVKRQKGRK